MCLVIWGGVHFDDKDFYHTNTRMLFILARALDTLQPDRTLRGVNIDDKDFYHTNTIITKAVQNFIISTKRFASNDKWSQPPQNLKSCALLFIVFFPICKYFQLFIIAYIINQFVIVWKIGKRS